jgi:lipoprotein-anchoring transpeptidase ErfK/SrfK
MSAVRGWGRSVAAALALTLVFAAAPAFAAVPPRGDAPPVVAFHVTVTGTDPVLDLFGLDAGQAHDAIAAACATPTLAPLAVDATGTPRMFDVAASVSLDVDGMVADALAATADGDLACSWTVDPAVIAAFVANVSQAVDRVAVNAKRTIVRHRLKVIKQVDGLSLDTTAAVSAVSDAIAAELAAGGSVQATVTVPVIVLPARVTTANIGKTILVVLHERWLYLYSGARLERKYRCAIGMRSYPTPVGTFKVVSKSPHPAWRNPYSAWSKKMPAVIKPGFYNPLGLRALYLSAPGIRIHGTAKTSSMGRAASHGCIRLTNRNVLDIYPRVPVGTPVYILR